MSLNNKHENGDAKDRVFLLTQEKEWDTEYAVGAIVFRWRKYSNAPEQLVLSWVWIHPFLRRQGILTAYWDIFLESYMVTFMLSHRYQQPWDLF